jgi:hypothetical protein
LKIAIPQGLKPALENKMFMAAVNRCATQRQNQNQNKEPSWTLSWNPTLAQKARKDGAPVGRF